MIHPPLKILLGQELWQDDIVAALVGLGHEVSALPAGYDVAISYDAWRIPAGTPQSEVLTHVGTIIKQVRATKHVPNTSEDADKGSAHSKPRAPVKRKPRVKKASGPATTEGTNEST